VGSAAVDESVARRLAAGIGARLLQLGGRYVVDIPAIEKKEKVIDDLKVVKGGDGPFEHGDEEFLAVEAGGDVERAGDCGKAEERDGDGVGEEFASDGSGEVPCRVFFEIWRPKAADVGVNAFDPPAAFDASRARAEHGFGEVDEVRSELDTERAENFRVFGFFGAMGEGLESFGHPATGVGVGVGVRFFSDPFEKEWAIGGIAGKEGFEAGEVRIADFEECGIAER